MQHLINSGIFGTAAYPAGSVSDDMGVSPLFAKEDKREERKKRRGEERKKKEW